MANFRTIVNFTDGDIQATEKVNELISEVCNRFWCYECPFDPVCKTLGKEIDINDIIYDISHIVSTYKECSMEEENEE